MFCVCFMVFRVHICCIHLLYCICCFFFFFKQKTAYEMRISDWSSDVCSSDLMGKEELARWVQYAKLNRAVILFDGAYEAYIRSSNPRSIYEIEIGRASCRERVCQYV